MPLGSGRIDELGVNRGLHELAGGAQICAEIERVMHECLLPPAAGKHGCRCTT